MSLRVFCVVQPGADEGEMLALAMARSGLHVTIVGGTSAVPSGHGEVRESERGGRRCSGSLELDETCQWAAQAMVRARALDDIPTDVVVAQGWVAAVVAERVAVRRKVPLVVVQDDEPVGAAWPGELVSLGASSAVRVVVGSERARERVLRAGGSAAPIVVVPLRDSIEAGRRLAELLREVVEEGRGTTGQPRRIYDVGLRVEGMPPSIVEGLLPSFARLLILKGAEADFWADACARCRVVLVTDLADLEFAAATGATPVLLRPSGRTRAGPGINLGQAPYVEATPETVVQVLAQCLSAPEVPRPCVGASQPFDPGSRITTASDGGRVLVDPGGPHRPLRVVINHGGLVAEELAASVAPWGWEVRPLLGPGRDPLPGADLLVSLPYGDPRGALDAVRRARRMGVPAAFWNVEDPRYFFDPELGPIVLALGREASAMFSTTTQLRSDYGAHGVDVHYLPNYGRGYFEVQASTPETLRTIDILFVGTLTPERERFLGAFRAGLGPEVSLVVRDDVRDPEALRALVASARLGLSVGTLTDTVTRHGMLRSEGLTERVFDYPLAWTPTLTDTRSCLADAFVVGEEVFVFDDVTSAVRDARDLLAAPQRRARAVSLARAKVVERDLGRHRLLAIVETLVAGGQITSPPVRAAAARARAMSMAHGAVPGTTA